MGPLANEAHLSTMVSPALLFRVFNTTFVLNLTYNLVWYSWPLGLQNNPRGHEYQNTYNQDNESSFSPVIGLLQVVRGFCEKS
jgi:hypothetical protein